jgi:hypothetical protein
MLRSTTIAAVAMCSSRGCPEPRSPRKTAPISRSQVAVSGGDRRKARGLAVPKARRAAEALEREVSFGTADGGEQARALCALLLLRPARRSSEGGRPSRRRGGRSRASRVHRSQEGADFVAKPRATRCDLVARVWRSCNVRSRPIPLHKSNQYASRGRLACPHQVAGTSALRARSA